MLCGARGDEKMKVDGVVRRESLFVAGWSVLLSLVMEAVFAALGAWNMTVLGGNALGLLVAAGNFFLMAMTVQTAVGREQKKAASLMKASQTGRMLAMLAVLIVGVAVLGADLWATLIPLFFPRIAIVLRPLFNKWLPDGETPVTLPEESADQHGEQ